MSDIFNKVIGFISDILPGGPEVKPSANFDSNNNKSCAHSNRSSRTASTSPDGTVTRSPHVRRTYTGADGPYSASAVRMAEEEAKRNKSYAQFLGLCVGITVVGVAFGVRRQLKREKFTFVYSDHKSSVLMAAKALAYGTALCGVGATASVFAAQRYYGFKTLEEFAALVRYKLDDFNNKAPEYVDEKRAIGGMSEKEEMNHWSKITGIDTGDDEDENDSSDISNSDGESSAGVGEEAIDPKDMLDPPSP